jgi:glucuronate isomerase
MNNFFDDKLLLSNDTAQKIYNNIKDLPIIDYHCHLDEKQIAENKSFSDIGELWLSTDHYKWRAMRLCGVDEYYITGKASYKDKFLKYAQIMPKLIGNPLYYWTHMELKTVFGINTPLNINTAEQVYIKANQKLKDINVQSILKQFKVEYIATTDDPVSNLEHHGFYKNTSVVPTFRPDRIFKWEDNYIKQLAQKADMEINNLDDLKKAYEKRLLFFITKGCVLADHGMDFLPSEDIDENAAEKLFLNRKRLNSIEHHSLFSHLIYFLAGLYKKHGLTMQLHFGTYRNINEKMFKSIGADSGMDVMRSYVDTDKLAIFLNELNSRDWLPKTVLYSLNPSAIKAIAVISGAFKDVLVGSAWWFNDTVQGIKDQLSVIAEYAALGTNLGMLTDSRSFTSYVRFDFFRRILADYLGCLVNKGECDIDAAISVAHDICYNNVKDFLKT